MTLLRSLLPLLAPALLAGAAQAQSSAARATRAASAGDSTLLSAYRWRNIGPDRGGRSIAATGVRGRPREAYFGATGGGLWKTTDGGDSWAPVTDGQITSASVGAVAVSESNPDIVYIGMGESCIRGNIMPGDGVYRSADGGRTWTHLGFRDVDAISKIRIHPTNPDIVYVAVFGDYGAPSEERGVFKTTDGGRTWRKVLYRDPKTAAVDLSMDPSDPNVLYAAMWEAYRTEWQMSSGGPGSGLFKSVDGGETWTELTRASGMPQSGVVGRIGVAVSGADGSRVYALVEHEKGGLFVSDDAGASWKLVNDDRAIRQRAFYYTHVFADPKQKDVVYLQNTSLFRSTDGGKTTQAINNGTHGDFHDMWIDADDPAHLVVANDGGGAVSTNTGGAWTAQDFPTAQFYHVITTAHVPYHACGAQQDNSTLCVPFDWNAGAFAARRGAAPRSASRPDSTPVRDITAGGMAFAYEAGGGEPGYIAADPRDPDIFFSGTNNGGYIDKFNRRLDTHREVNPYPWFYSGEPSREIRERWQWTFPIIFSPIDSQTLYTSSQRLWKTTDGGRTWTAISGDLTRHDPRTQGPSGGPITGDMNGPEVYGTIFSVAPGKRSPGTIWTGSDDGLVHLTRDGGATWTNVTPPDMPDFGRVSQIDASAFSDSVAYVSVRRPLLGDVAPHVFRTTDHGRTWTKIVAGMRGDAYVHVVREDPLRRGLLYAGTQHGAYVSFDDGARWQSLALDMPDVPIADLIVKENELVVATHGRGFWVLDGLAALRQAGPARPAEAVRLFAPAAAVRSGPGLTFSYWLGKQPASARLEILDSAGTVLRSFEPDTTKPDSAARGQAQGGRRRGGVQYLPREAGLNRLAYDLRTQPIASFPGMILWGARTDGPQLPPGRYTARLTADGQRSAVSFEVKRHPLITDVSDADLRAQFEFSRRVRDRADSANRAVIAIRSVKAQLDDRLAKAKGDAALARAADSLRAHASAIEEQIYQVRNRSGQDPLNFPIKVNNRLANLLAMAQRGDGPPNAGMREIFDILSAELERYTTSLAQVWRTDLAAVNRELARLSLPAVSPATPLATAATTADASR